MDGKDPDITEEKNLWLPAYIDTLQTGKEKNDERSTEAAGGHRDPHIKFSRKGATK